MRTLVWGFEAVTANFWGMAEAEEAAVGAPPSVEGSPVSAAGSGSASKTKPVLVLRHNDHVPMGMLVDALAENSL